MKRTFAALATTLSIVACAPPQDYNAMFANGTPPSASIKSQIVHDARDFLNDPYSVRDAEISEVGTFTNGNQVVCVKANAKNAMGGYSGRQTLAVFIQGGKLIGNQVSSPICANPNVKWLPFPELEALKKL